MREGAEDAEADAAPQHAVGRRRHAATVGGSRWELASDGDDDLSALLGLDDARPADAGERAAPPTSTDARDEVDAIVDTAAPPYEPRPRSRGIGRRARGIAGRIVLDVLALAGLVCILLVAASFVFKVSIVMFATGSMAPTIPAGSIAFVREIPASEIAVGDVVTVDRSDEQLLPVTHRVVEIVDVSGDVVTFRMQGDDNAQPDPEAYAETTVRLVMASIPGLATVIVWFQNPFVLGGITIGATVLVTWAFWPREQRAEASAAAQHAD